MVPIINSETRKLSLLKEDNSAISEGRKVPEKKERFTDMKIEITTLGTSNTQLEKAKKFKDLVKNRIHH